MKVSALKYQKKTTSINSTNLDIQTFGDNNDFYQIVMKIIEGSVTGKSCVNVYSKFINGRGFSLDTYNIKINGKGQTLDDLLRMIAGDYAKFNGFALHVNYNALGQKVSVYHIPFEHVRLQALDKDGNFSKVAIHPDWARENLSLKAWNQKDIKYYDLYNSDINIINQQADNAGGWSNYQGQVYYYSGNGDISYPLPIFSMALTDMSSDEGLSNINYRNIRNRFMSGGVLCGIKREEETTYYEESGEETEALMAKGREEESEDQVKDQLIQFQGDEEACKIAYIEVANKDEIPTFIPFQTNNYDKDYTSAESSIKDKIGRAFNQPPILRAENIGAGFGAELMQACYDYYNSVTETERYDIERVFTEVFSNWKNGEINNFTIQPKIWGGNKKDAN